MPESAIPDITQSDNPLPPAGDNLCSREDAGRV